MKIKDLPAPVTASKADWLSGRIWLGFTPTQDSVEARARCQSVVNRQFGNGYVLEYVTETFGKPNEGFRDDPTVHADKARHDEVKGCLVAIHRLRATARPLDEIIGAEEFSRLQDIWASNGKRRRWSVAFPIVETYDIVDTPKAKPIFKRELYEKLYKVQSSTLRNLSDDHRKAIADLEIVSVKAPNARILIEDEIEASKNSQINAKILAQISSDLSDQALEGFDIEMRGALRRRAAWLAEKFIRNRSKCGRLRCDICGFDPSATVTPVPISARSLLDVHHKNPLAEGRRVTNIADFALLCPNCHRLEHALLRKSASLLGSLPISVH